MEARLFEEGTIPAFTTPEFFNAHPWISPVHQHGHQERTEMASRVIHRFVTVFNVRSIVDLGCGDGSLLSLLQDIDIPMWGYDAGAQNIERAREFGLDVRFGDVTRDTDLVMGDLVVATEMVEHLLDPHTFIRNIPGTKLVLTSPSAETADWHYEHHAWAWDSDGYIDMVENAGWTVIHQEECDAAPTTHNGELRLQRFQALVAVKEAS